MAELNWFKGNLHMHSFWSDGNEFPEMAAEWFKNNGYQFIAFTEHDQHQVGERWFRCDPSTGQGRAESEGNFLSNYMERWGSDWVETRVDAEFTEVRLKTMSEYRHLFEEPGRFLMINGEEITTTWGEADRSQRHWINTFNTPDALPPQHHDNSSTDAMQQVFALANDVGNQSGRNVFTYLNHPNFIWNATAEDIAATTVLRHVEIHTALNSCFTYGDDTHASAERIWDVALSLRLSRSEELIYGLATDDCHAYTNHHSMGLSAMPGRAWVMVQASHLTPDHIMGSMNRGDYYCSTGVTFSGIELDERGIRLQIEPAAGARYVTKFIGTRQGFDASSTPVLDEQGNEIRTTRNYSDDVGHVLSQVEGLEPVYTIQGDELYVRAVVESDIPHCNPTIPGDTQKAWTQPITGASK